MKRKIYTLALLAALCGTAFVACKKDDPLAGKDYNTIITVKSNDGKTHYNPFNGGVEWDSDDEISVARGNVVAENPFELVSLENGVAKFGGNISATEGSYYAVYPAQDIAINNGVVTCEVIQTEQILTENTFGKGNNTSVGCGPSTTMEFKNLGGLAKIAVRGTFPVKSIKISCSGTPLSGRGSVDLLSMGQNPTIEWASEGTFDYVEAVAPETNGVSVEGGKWFYVVLPPCTMNRYTVTLAGTHGENLVKEYTTSVTISRSSVVLLGAFEADDVATIPESNQICYTATSKLVFSSNEWWMFTVTNHRYAPETGKGCVTFSETITSIPNNAFYNWSTMQGNNSITSITLPASVTSIGMDAFHGCSNLASVSMPGVQTIDMDAFFECSRLTSVSMPEVQNIGLSAFEQCDIRTVELPAIQTIGRFAFMENNHLQSVDLGSSIGSLGIDAFAFCFGSISVVICRATSCPSYDADYPPFELGLTDDAVLHVPQGRRDAYSAWSGWFGGGIVDDLPSPSNK